jgi:hypothetical protein
MSDNNINFDALASSFEELSAHLRGSGGAAFNMEQALKKAKAAEEAAIAARQKAMAEQYASWKKVSGAMTGFTQQAMGSSDGFDTLKTVVGGLANAIGGLMGMVPGIGGALKAMGEAAGEVAKMMIDQFQVGWKAYGDLANSGLASSFEDMKDTAAKTGLLFQDVNKALGKHSTDLANFGGSAAKGAKMFGSVALSLDEVREKFNRLGIGAAEFNEFQAQYMAQETRMGRARNTDLKTGTESYIKELDMLAKLTGQSRKDLANQRDQALSEARFAASMADLAETMGPEQAKKVEKNFQDLNSVLISKAGPGFAQGFRDFASGNATTEAAKALDLATNGAMAPIIDAMKNGKMTFDQAFAKMQKSLDPKTMGQIAKYTGDASTYTKLYVENLKMKNAAELTPQEVADAAKAQEEALSGKKEETAALANTQQQMYDTSRNLQLVMTSSGAAAKALDVMSDGLNYLSEKIAEITGTELPAEVKARKEERAEIKKLNDLKKKESDYDIEVMKNKKRILDLEKEIAAETDPKKKRRLEGQLRAAQNVVNDEEKFGGEERDKRRKEIMAQEAKVSAATANRKSLSNAPAASGGGGPGQATTQQQLKDSGLTIKSGDVQKDGAEIDPQLLEIAKQVQSTIPGFKHFSSFNDKFHNESSPTSGHTKGKAFDFTVEKKPTPEEGKQIVAALKGMGLGLVIDEYNNPSSKATAGHFHGEIKMAGGGIINATPGGQRVLAAEAGMNEAFVPLPNGKSIPVTVSGGSEKQEALLSSIFEKMSEMVSLLDDANGHHKKIAGSLA